MERACLNFMGSSWEMVDGANSFQDLMERGEKECL